VSIFFIQVFHDGKRPELIAETTVDAAHCLRVEFQCSRKHSHFFHRGSSPKSHTTSFSARALDLPKPGKASKLENAALLISCRYEETASGSTLPAAHVGLFLSFPLVLPPPVHLWSIECPGTICLQGERFRANVDSSGIELVGTVISAISPHNFATVVGFLEGFESIGDAISEVSFYLASNSYHQTEILKGPPICKACLDGANCHEHQPKNIWSNVCRLLRHSET
jgi:hypothetical protein